MSRGPGRVERGILAAFKDQPDNAFTITDLCKRIYGGGGDDRRQRVAVLRSLRSIARRNTDLHIVGGFKDGVLQGFSADVTVCNLASVTSFAMARLKNDTKFERYRWTGDEASLQAQIAPGGRHHDCVVEGGAWWRHWQMVLAQRDGDQQRLAVLQAEQDRDMASLGANIKRALAATEGQAGTGE